MHARKENYQKRAESFLAYIVTWEQLLTVETPVSSNTRAIKPANLICTNIVT